VQIFRGTAEETSRLLLGFAGKQPSHQCFDDVAVAADVPSGLKADAGMGRPDSPDCSEIVLGVFALHDERPVVLLSPPRRGYVFLTPEKLPGLRRSSDVIVEMRQRIIQQPL